MDTFSKGKIEHLISLVKAELLSHALQDDVLSPNIKNINLHLDEFLTALETDTEITQKPRNTRTPKVYGSQRDNILFIAYCMSKLDYQFVNSITGEYIIKLKLLVSWHTN